MSFLDNLESNLKDLESKEERDPGARKKRDAERASALAAAPWAEKLKSSPYTQEVLNSAARLGFQTRNRINVAWLGTTLKLEVKERRLELRPISDGIVAVFLHNGKEEQRLSVDLAWNAHELVEKWLGQSESEK